MKTEYDTFITNIKELPLGQEIELGLRDLTPGPRQYDSRWVKAVINTSSENTSGSDVLWIRFPLGFLHPEPYAIKILEVLGTYRPILQKVVKAYQVYSYQAPL